MPPVSIPKHIAIIMDGNGRWAEGRGLPRHAGHKEGVRPVRMCIEECARRGVGALTLFAFSSENWQRPAVEVSSLMQLFLDAIDREVEDLHKNKVRLRFIGDRQALSVKLQSRMAASEELTAANRGLKLQVAVSYGGRWDIVQAARRLAAAVASGALPLEAHRRGRASRASWQLGELRRSRPLHPHRRRPSHQQFPAVEPGVHRAARLRHVVAGLRRGASRSGARGVRRA